MCAVGAQPLRRPGNARERDVSVASAKLGVRKVVGKARGEEGDRIEGERNECEPPAARILRLAAFVQSGGGLVQQ